MKKKVKIEIEMDLEYDLSNLENNTEENEKFMSEQFDQTMARYFALKWDFLPTLVDMDDSDDHYPHGSEKIKITSNDKVLLDWDAWEEKI